MKWLAGLTMILTVFLGSACSPVVRDRTLPPSVRSIYMPMIDNRTSEIGLEERLTVAAQEEFLADGRLDLVREDEADAIVDVTLRQFQVTPLALDSDDYATAKMYRLETTFRIKENIPGRPSIGGRRSFMTQYFFNDDPRTTTFNPEPDEKAELARVFSRQLVLEVITGQFDETFAYEADPYRDSETRLEVEPLD